MDPLWDEEENYDGKELSKIDSGQLIAFESNKQNSIVERTIKFAGALQSCEAVVVAAYKVADYVPPFQNDAQSAFWKETVIPILMQSLQQDVKARSVITRSFGVVGDLAIVIQNVYEIVRRSRGSKKAIEIAKKDIPAAIGNLNDCIALVEQLDSNAFANFAQQSNKIFEIIGPEAAKFAEQKEELDEQIRKKIDKQQKLVSELGEKKGQVESLYYLIEMTEKHVARTEADLQEAQQRKSELNKLNDHIENTIQNIPQKIQKTVTESGRSGMWFWRRSWVEVENPDRESQERYYNNIIKSRVERLKTTENNENATKNVMETLQKEIAEYKKNYQKGKEELDTLQKAFAMQMAEIQRDIDSDLVAKQEIEKNALDTFETIGLQGNTLIAALVHVRTFARSLKPGASAYSPFSSILNSVKKLVEAHIDLLSSDDPSDIFLAGTLLIEQVNFLSKYTVTAQRIMKATDDYDEQAITEKMQHQSITF